MAEYKPNVIERISTRLMGPRPPINEAAEKKALQAMRGRGVYEQYVAGDKGVTSKVTRGAINRHFNWYIDDSTVRSGINSLVEDAVGLGYRNVMPTGYHAEEDEEGEPIVPEEKRLCDEFGRVMNLDHFMPNVTRIMLIAGFCPVETKITKFPSKSGLKIIHPKTVKTLHSDDNGFFDYLIQDDGSTFGKKFTSDEVTLFTYNQMGNDYTGLSLVKTVENLLSIKHSALNNMEGMIERYISPLYIWRTTGDVTPIKNAIEHRQSGEDIFLGNMDLNEFDQFEARPIEVQGDSKFSEFITFVDQLIWIGINSPNQMYWRNATEASATVLEDMIDRQINAIQRVVARGMEDGFYRRLLTENGYPVESDMDITPRVAWGIEKTGTEDIRPEEIVRMGLELFYIQEPEFWDLMYQMGFKIKPKRKLARGDEEPPAEEPTVEPDDDEEEPVEEPTDTDDEVEDLKKKVYEKMLEKLE